MGNPYDSDVSAKLRRHEEMKREADALEPGVTHKIIDFGWLEQIHGGDPQKIYAAVRAVLAPLTPGKWEENPHIQAALAGEEMVYHTRDAQGHWTRVLILQPLPKGTAIDHAARSSDFSPPLCRTLRLERKFSPAAMEMAAFFAEVHEFAHWVAPNPLPQPLPSQAVVDHLDWRHPSETFADVFATLCMLQRFGPSAAPFCEHVAQLRSIKAFNKEISAMENREPVSDEQHINAISHMSGRAIRAAITAAHSHGVAHLPGGELLRMAGEIAMEQRYSPAELEDIYRGMVRVTTEKSWFPAAQTPSDALFLPRACPEEERMSRALSLGILDPQKPWVQEMIQAWEGLTGTRVKDQKPAIDIPFTAAVTRRDPLRPEPSSGRGGK